MKIKPLSNNIFLEVEEGEKKTKSGIYIPETVEKDHPMRGTVVATGPGKRTEKGDLIPMTVKKGDTLLFKSYGLTEVKVEGKKYLVGSEDDVLAIVE
jgi:chaperonin GroES